MRPRKALFAVLAGAAATVAVAVPAYATTENVEGGRWIYDADWNNGVNYSYYFHEKAPHGSSVSNQKYGVVRSDCKPAWTQAEAVESLDYNGGNRAYYRFCFPGQ